MCLEIAHAGLLPRASGVAKYRAVSWGLGNRNQSSKVFMRRQKEPSLLQGQTHSPEGLFSLPNKVVDTAVLLWHPVPRGRSPG